MPSLDQVLQLLICFAEILQGFGDYEKLHLARCS